MITSFTIRVYGLLIHNGHILLSKEDIKGGTYTKFPGGGLEFGEGALDCLKREYMEEAGIAIHSLKHFYTTEDFVASWFDEEKQVISIYYTIKSEEAHKIETDVKVDSQILFWKKMEDLTTESVDLPIDKIVVGKLLNSIKE